MVVSADSGKDSDAAPTRSGMSRLASVFLRLALGAGFLSAVADRLGLWGPPGTSLVAWGNFHNFLAYTAKLNPWCPPGCVPALGWIATAAEVALGLSLVLGFRTRMAGVLSGLLTLAFALAMTFVLGIHAPLNYSVFVFSAASLLLASEPTGTWSLDRLARRRSLRNP